MSLKIYSNVEERKRVNQPSVNLRKRSCRRTFKVLPLFCRGIFIIGGVFLFSFTGFNSIAHSETYFLSPSGSNANAGTAVAPWKTFSFVIPKLRPGDVLILKDGKYDGSNSGYPNINGSKNANNGTRQNPITVKAENERKAFIDGTGLIDTLRIANLSFWNFEGIYAKSRENHNSTSGNVIRVTNSANLVFKRLLLTHNNRWVNTHLMSLEHCAEMLVEESEFYTFHRHAILGWYTNNSIYRRNYFNSRGYKDVTGGYASFTRSRGEAGITLYPGSNNIVENVISEGNGFAADIQAKVAAVNNRFFGVISLNDTYGIVPVARGDGDKMPKDTYIENFVCITPKKFCIYARSAKNTLIKGAALIGKIDGKSSGLAADAYSYPGDGVYSTFTENLMVMNHSSYGISNSSQATWSHDHSNAYNNKVDFNPTANLKSPTTLNPGFGTCKVFVPEASPLKRKGVGGADIGANILYRYKNGVLTSQPLWNATTGEFPHGALVRGVNDIAGSSLFDVHKRLNVNANGCMLPQNYGAGEGPDLTPKNLRRVVTLSAG